MRVVYLVEWLALMVVGCVTAAPTTGQPVLWVNVSSQRDGAPALNGSNGIGLGTPACIPGGALNLKFDQPARTNSYAAICENTGPGLGGRECMASEIGVNGFFAYCFPPGSSVPLNICTTNVNIACHVVVN